MNIEDQIEFIESISALIKEHGMSDSVMDMINTVEDLEDRINTKSVEDMLLSLEGLNKLIKKNVGFTDEIAKKYINQLGVYGIYKDSTNSDGNDKLNIPSTKDVRNILRDVNSWCYLVGELGAAIKSGKGVDDAIAMFDAQVKTVTMTGDNGIIKNNIEFKELSLKKLGWMNPTKIEKLALFMFNIDKYYEITHAWLDEPENKEYRKYATSKSTMSTGIKKLINNKL